METLSEVNDKIFNEVVSDDPEIRQEFLAAFEEDAKEFSVNMAKAVAAWREIDSRSSISDERAHISAIVYTAIALHVQSMKLFLSGHIVASGNLFRQVVETISLALLCSQKSTHILERFIADDYKSNTAVRDVLRHSEKIHLLSEGVLALKNALEFYHLYSHPTKLTIAAFSSFVDRAPYIGSSFDAEKFDWYRSEVQGRVSLSDQFENFITAIKINVGED